MSISKIILSESGKFNKDNFLLPNSLKQKLKNKINRTDFTKGAKPITTEEYQRVENLFKEEIGDEFKLPDFNEINFYGVNSSGSVSDEGDVYVFVTQKSDFTLSVIVFDYASDADRYNLDPYDLSDQDEMNDTDTFNDAMKLQWEENTINNATFLDILQQRRPTHLSNPVQSAYRVFSGWTQNIIESAEKEGGSFSADENSYYLGAQISKVLKSNNYEPILKYFKNNNIGEKNYSLPRDGMKFLSFVKEQL